MYYIVGPEAGLMRETSLYWSTSVYNITWN